METMQLDFMQRTNDPARLELYLYDAVGSADGETSSKYFREELSRYPTVKNIDLYINSVGGSVSEGYAIYSQIKRHPAYKTVYIDGMAHSIASVIAMAGDKIVMRSHSIMGIHNAGAAAAGDAKAHRKLAEELDRLMEGNRQIYLDRSKGKITLEKLTELLDKETMLTARECLQYGFCDEIADWTPTEGFQQRMKGGKKSNSLLSLFQGILNPPKPQLDIAAGKELLWVAETITEAMDKKTQKRWS